MEPVIAQALATLIGAIATAILMASAFYWGPNRRGNTNDRKEHDDHYHDSDDGR